MSAATIQSDVMARVESIARRLHPDAAEDFRVLMSEIFLPNLQAALPGGNLITPGGAKAGSSAPPTGVSHSVAGANAQYTVSIANPTNVGGRPIWHEISYSPLKSFTRGVVTQEPTTQTTVQIPSPGGSFAFRLRSSFDKVSWSPYQYSTTTPVDAGYVESSALSRASALNQSNFAVVNSQSFGGLVGVTVNGIGGNFTPYIAVRGGVQSIRPSATIIGPFVAGSQMVTWDGAQFHLASTVAEALSDDNEPVGHVQVGSGTAGGGGTTGANDGRLVGAY